LVCFHLFHELVKLGRSLYQVACLFERWGGGHEAGRSGTYALSPAQVGSMKTVSAHFNSACFSIDAAVFGAKSPDGYPAKLLCLIRGMAILAIVGEALKHLRQNQIADLENFVAYNSSRRSYDQEELCAGSNRPDARFRHFVVCPSRKEG
jgi:hypothetical protein